jgi:hypothetical protein
MPTVSGVTSRAAVSAPKHYVPAEAEVRSIRKALDGDVQPEDIDFKKLPKAVQDYANKLQKKEGDNSSVGVQTFAIGGKSYYVVDADNEGNGYADILSARGDYVTGYSYSESEGPNWAASPLEAQREKAASNLASNLFKRSALGTSKLAKQEVKVTDLPQKLQDQVKNHNVKDEHFYKFQVAGQTMFADYVLYQGADSKPSTQIGNVTVSDKDGSWMGSADILNKSGDALKFGFNLGRPE